MEDQLTFKIALSMIPGIGDVLAKNLVSYCGSVEAVFSESRDRLLKIPGIGPLHASRVKDKSVLALAEKQLAFARENHIKIFFYTDPGYPRRLQACHDAPVLLYAKGDFNFNEERVVSIVGTRKATDYGKGMCDLLIREMAERGYKVLIVSGLAYGIDVQAHKSSIKYKLPTIGVLGHGLDKLYPALHKTVAGEMQKHGGLVSDFHSGAKIDPQNFLQRNRIIAGLADATIVVESGFKGGALVTANIANSYNRDVFAFPGRVGDPLSEGCNQLIKNNGAFLMEKLDDLEYIMGWESGNNKPDAVQPSLFVELGGNEQLIYNLLKNKGELFIDQVCAEVQLPMGQVSSTLLELEFKGLVAALPGKMYRAK